MEPKRKKIKLDIKSKCTPSFRDLPEELVDEILGYCKINDILKLSEVDKYWNSYVKTSQKWMKKITLTVTERNYKEIVNCTRQYKKVCIQSKPPLKYEPLNNALQHQFETIRDIELPIINLASITFPNLVKLHLKNSWNYCEDSSLDQRDFYFTKPRRDIQKRLDKDLIRTYSYLAYQLEYLYLSTVLNSSESILAPGILRNIKIFKVLLVNQEPIVDNSCIITLNFDLDLSDDSLFIQRFWQNEIKQVHEITWNILKRSSSFLCSSSKNSSPKNPQ